MSDQSDGTDRIARRTYLAAATGLAAAVAGCGGGGGGDGGDRSGDGGSDGSGGDGGNGLSEDVQSQVDDYLSGANNYDSVVDRRGNSQVTVDVGAGNGFAFGPAAVRIDAGTTVTWDWTGMGGAHNVVHEGGDFESELLNGEGNSYEYTFDSGGVYKYYCQPHKQQGMKGVVVVG